MARNIRENYGDVMKMFNNILVSATVQDLLCMFTVSVPVPVHMYMFRLKVKAIGAAQFHSILFSFDFLSD